MLTPRSEYVGLALARGHVFTICDTIPSSGLSLVVVGQALSSRIRERKTRHSPNNGGLRDAGFMETPLNHFFNERSDPRTLDALTRGPLAAHLRTYAQQLHDQGYAVSSGQSQLRMLGHFNRWLQSKKLGAEQIDSSTLERYVRCRPTSSKKVVLPPLAACGACSGLAKSGRLLRLRAPAR
jgi:hypothetical protein